MFKQGARPAVVIERAELAALRRTLRALGYECHEGPRTTREGEIGAWRGNVGRGRQVHVQAVLRTEAGGDAIDLYAHTEPAGHGLRHAVSAIFDRANFGAGARALVADLRADGWTVGR